MLKKSLVFVLLFLIILAAILAHGVVVPRSIWQPQLDRLQAKFPDQTLEINRVVVGLSHRPHLMLSGVQITSPESGERLDFGLLHLEADGWESFKARQLIIDELGIKGMKAVRQTRWDCEQRGLRCLPLTPIGLLVAGRQQLNALPGRPTLQLDRLSLNRIELLTEDLQGTPQLRLGVDELRLVADAGTQNTFKAAFRVWKSDHDKDNPQSGQNTRFTMRAIPKDREDRELTLIGFKNEIAGEWKNLPWTAAVDADMIRFSQPRREGEGGLFKQTEIDFSGTGLRSYLRREDDPSRHSAAFSSQSFTGALPDSPMHFDKAEWTFTDEKAEAWTFNLDLNLASGLIEIQPQTIEGSEGEPAEAQMRQINCLQRGEPALFGLVNTGRVDEYDLRRDKPFWIWNQGWFKSSPVEPDGSAELMLCPVERADASGTEVEATEAAEPAAQADQQTN